MFIAIAFLAGLAGRSLVQNASGALRQKDPHASDLAAIEKFHKEDLEATLAQDSKGLIDIFADDAVRFNPPGPPAVGKQVIQAENEKFHAQFPGFKVLSYTPRYSGIQIKGKAGIGLRLRDAGQHRQSQGGLSGFPNSLEGR